ncbi:MAG: hypothetical protein QXU64_03045 [Thermofilaceae archaeon]
MVGDRRGEQSTPCPGLERKGKKVGYPALLRAVVLRLAGAAGSGGCGGGAGGGGGGVGGGGGGGCWGGGAGLGAATFFSSPSVP